MRLNIEVSAKASWYEDKMRRKLKLAINQAILDVIEGMGNDNAELNSLRFSVPTTKRRKAAS